MNLEDLNKQNAFVMVGGKARVIHESYDEEKPDKVVNIEFYRIQDFKHYYAPHKIGVADKEGNMKQ